MDSTLTHEQRVARGKLAAETRWGKRFDWETSSIEDCKAKLADMRAEAERGGLILQRRMSIERVSTANCYNPACNKPIDITSGRFAGTKSRHNPDTGILETAYACSAACFLYLTNNFKHAPVIREPVVEVNPEFVNNEPAKPLL